MTAAAKTRDRTSREELDHLVAEHERWLNIEREDRRELASLNEEAAERVLDDPASAEHVAAETARLTAHADLASKAAAAADARTHQARLRIVAEEADRLEDELAPVRKELADHEAKTQKLLKTLEDHTDSEWREWTVARQEADIRAQNSGGPIYGRIEFRTPWADTARSKIHHQERLVTILRTVAAEEPVSDLLSYGENELELFPDIIIPARGGVIAPIGYEHHWWATPTIED
ncbi:hypothetical protein IEE94_11460 [Yimella sp. cx-573]|nr:hypothetical protein [Yimella sp. cx-573]